MNKKIVLIVVLALGIIGIFVGVWWVNINDQPVLPVEESVANPGFSFPAAADEINWEDREVYKSGLTSDAQSALNGLPQASIYYITLEIGDDISGDIDGHEIVRYTNAEVEPLDEIYFRLFPNFQGGKLTISNLTVDGAEAEIDLEAADSALRVELGQALGPGDSVVVEMDFSLGIPTEMGGNWGLFGYFDDVLALDTFYPMIPAYDENGWYKSYPQPNGDHTYLDASFYLVQVQAPADMDFASSGVAVDHQEKEGRQTTVFAAGPARDFYLAGSQKYVELSEQVGNLTVKVHAKEEYSLHQGYALEVAVKAIEILSERVGDYPYTEFEVTSSPMKALGIEYPGITNIVVDEFIPGEMYGTPSEVYLESTLAHEVGHMWFYNVIGNDQQNEPWVDEALVQYLTYIYYLDSYGSGEGYASSWYGRWERVEFAEIPIGLPAGEYDGSEYSAIVYGRGPLFFLELEQEYGLETVMSAIEDYYDTYLWGIAGEPELRGKLEDACGCDLTEKFEKWVYEN